LISPDFGCSIFEQTQLLSFGAAGRALRRAAPALAGKLNLPLLQRLGCQPVTLSARSARCDNSFVELCGGSGIIRLGNFGIKKTNADQRRA
jgi:hypothetical protein